jgi:hypothetical protein
MISLADSQLGGNVTQVHLAVQGSKLTTRAKDYTGPATACDSPYRCSEMHSPRRPGGYGDFTEVLLIPAPRPEYHT